MTGYAWVDGLDAYCFTVLHGVEVDEAIRRLGGDPGATQRRTFEECFWRPDCAQWIQVGPVGAGVVLAENNGWRVSEDDTAMNLSRGGRLTSTFCDVSAVMRFVYAVDGVIRAAFDPLLDKRPEEGTDPRCLDGLLADLPFDLDAVARSAMTLMERISGVRIEAGWLDDRQRAFALPPLR